MSLRLDLARHAKRGLAYVLPLLAGGTGRTDGLTRGTVIEVYNSSGATISAGVAVKINSVGSTSPVMNVTPTTAPTDRVIGYAIDDIADTATGLIQIVGVCTVLTTGDVAYNDELGPSSTAGRLQAVSSGNAFARSRQATTGTSSVQADIVTELAITGGDQCVPTVIVSAEYVAGSIVFDADDNPSSLFDYTEVLAGVAGQYMLAFSAAESAQVPAVGLTYHEFATSPGTEPDPEALTSDVQGPASGSFRISGWHLADPDPGEVPPVGAHGNPYIEVNHAADGWSIHCALLFRGVGDGIVASDHAEGTSAAPSITVPTRPGDIVVAAVFDPSTDAVTSAAGQTNLGSGSGGFEPRRLRVDQKTADETGSTTLSWTLTGSRAWAVAALVIRGDVEVGDGHEDIVGTDTNYPRCDHKHHVLRAFPPTAIHDIEAGYPVLTMWTDTVTHATYLSIDETEGAALWLQIGSGSTSTPTTHATTHQAGGSDPITLDDLASPDDNTDLNASAAKHGLLRKLSGSASDYLDGSGAWSVPPAGMTNPMTTRGDLIRGNAGGPGGPERLALGADGTRLVSDGTDPVWEAERATLNFVIDGGGSAITTGVKGDIVIDVACVIESVTLLADASGSIVIDIWKDTYANFPPVVGDSITASAKPTLSSQSKSQDATLTGWTTAIAAGDVLRVNVDSAATVQRVTLAVKLRRT